MKKSGALTGLLGLIIAAMAYADARSFPIQNLENGLGAAFFPLLIITALAVLSVLSCLLGVFGKGAQQELEFREEGTRSAIALLVAMILFLVAFGSFGLHVPSILFIAGAAWLLGAPPLRSVLIGILGGTAVRVFFINILNVHLT